MATFGIASTFDNAGQLVASQRYSDAVLGPCVIGWVGQVFLAGIALTMAINYWSSEAWARDPTRRKVLLVAVVGLCLAQVGQNVWLIYFWLTTQQRAAADLVRPTIPDALQPLSVAFIAPLVQSFLASRAIRLLHARWAKFAATAVFVFLLVCEFGAAMTNVAVSLRFHNGTLSGVLLKFATYSTISGIWLLFGALADIAITVLLCLVLRKRILGFSSTTDAKIVKLIRLAWQSASYTALAAAAAAVIAYAAPTDNLLYSSVPYAFWYLLPSLYPIALLTAFSSRKIFSNTSSNSRGDTIKTNFLTMGNGLTAANFASPIPGSPHSPHHPLSPVLPSDRPRSRFFQHAVDFRSSPRNSPLTRSRSNMAPKSIQVQVEKHVSVVVDSDDETDLAVPFVAPRRPTPAVRETTSPSRRGRTVEKDLEAGIESEGSFSMGTITGRSARKEVWQ